MRSRATTTLLSADRDHHPDARLPETTISTLAIFAKRRLDVARLPWDSLVALARSSILLVRLLILTSSRTCRESFTIPRPPPGSRFTQGFPLRSPRPYLLVEAQLNLPDIRRAYLSDKMAFGTTRPLPAAIFKVTRGENAGIIGGIMPKVRMLPLICTRRLFAHAPSFRAKLESSFPTPGTSEYTCKFALFTARRSLSRSHDRSIEKIEEMPVMQN